MNPYFSNFGSSLYCGDVREVLRSLPDGSAQTCVTSPPYFGLRDYGVAGQIGLEQTPEAYVAEMVAVFREVRRVLKEDGTLWLNLGDSYATNGGAHGGREDNQTGVGGKRTHESGAGDKSARRAPNGLKAKDLIGIPWRVAFALQQDGWYLRQDIIWHKPNPMPESVRDRCTKAHEYIFLLSKSERYYFDSDAIKEPSVTKDIRRPYGSPGANAMDPRGKQGAGKPRGGKNAFRGQGHFREGEGGHANREGRNMREVGVGEFRNRRSVWTVSTKPYRGAHFATFPADLIEPCILAGAPRGGVVLEPFCGSGTTLATANKHGRRAVGVELNPEYCKLAVARLNNTPSEFSSLD